MKKFLYGIFFLSAVFFNTSTAQAIDYTPYLDPDRPGQILVCHVPAFNAGPESTYTMPISKWESLSVDLQSEYYFGACESQQNKKICFDTCGYGIYHLNTEGKNGTELWSIDVYTGMSQLLVIVQDGINLRQTLAMNGDFSFYSLMVPSGSSNRKLVKINGNGSVVTIGDTGITGTTEALAFGTDGQLYAIEMDTESLYRIDLATGAATLLKDYDKNTVNFGGGDLVINENNELIYVSYSNGLIAKIDLNDANYPISLLGNLPTPGANQGYTSLAYYNGVYYAMLRDAGKVVGFNVEPYAEVIIDVRAPIGFGDGASCPRQIIPGTDTGTTGDDTGTTTGTDTGTTGTETTGTDAGTDTGTTTGTETTGTDTGTTTTGTDAGTDTTGDTTGTDAGTTTGTDTATTTGTDAGTETGTTTGTETTGTDSGTGDTTTGTDVGTTTGTDTGTTVGTETGTTDGTGTDAGTGTTGDTTGTDAGTTTGTDAGTDTGGTGLTDGGEDSGGVIDDGNPEQNSPEDDNSTGASTPAPAAGPGPGLPFVQGSGASCSLSNAAAKTPAAHWMIFLLAGLPIIVRKAKQI